MSYDIYLMKFGHTCQVESHTEGGTYALGGTTDASLNITYNYGEVYYRLLGWGIVDLDRERASNWIERLEQSVEKLGTKQYVKDYWAPTLGNAGHALNVLLAWARQYPEATFYVR